MITAFHAKYFALALIRRCPSDSVQKLAASLADAQVDLNPHQIDAALFAFRSPLSKGAILADEVGLGKTIEAGILLSQRWAERKRKLLVIVPANLRKQWHQELADKFFLPATILETRTFNEQVRKQGNLNPFDQPDTIIICSYHFARSKEAYIREVAWNLVVIDEAHRLRNVYKQTNRIANAIKSAVAEFPKVLLTATPLQNSLLELYGLVSVIDDYTFGDLKSFKVQFTNLSGEAEYAELRTRLKPICQRTLRRQVLEYVPYTTRFYLQPHARFEDGQNAFFLTSNPFPGEAIHPGPYRAVRPVQRPDGQVEDANLYRVGHPLAQRIIRHCSALSPGPAELAFSYTGSGKTITILESLVGSAGWLCLAGLTISSFDTEDWLLFAGITDAGQELDPDQCQRMFSLAAMETPQPNLAANGDVRHRLDAQLARQQQTILAALSEKNGRFFELEMEKLEGWAGDFKESLEHELKEIDREIKDTKREAQLAGSLETKVSLHKRVKEIEARRSEKRRGLFEAQDAVDARKDTLLTEVEARLKQTVTRTELFTVRWRIA